MSESEHTTPSDAEIEAAFRALEEQVERQMAPVRKMVADIYAAFARCAPPPNCETSPLASKHFCHRGSRSPA